MADRLFAVLESCARSSRALSLSELVESTGLPKTTLHRTCWKLVELNALEREGNGFRIGTKLFALGSMSPRLRRLRATSMPFLQELAGVTGRVVNLAVLSDRRALIVEEVFGGVAPSMPKMVGATMPSHATAIGKALLMYQPDEVLDAVIGERLLRPFTPHTIVRPSVLREHLETARRDGSVRSREEWRLGTSAVAAPVVVRGETVAAVAAVCLSDRELARLAVPVRSAAGALEAALGGTGLAAAA